MAHAACKGATNPDLECPAKAGWRDSCGVDGKGGAWTMYIGGGVILVILVIILLIWVL
jgi:hypothetical protein